MYSVVGLHFLRAVDVYLKELSARPSRAATIHILDPLDDAVNALTYRSFNFRRQQPLAQNRRQRPALEARLHSPHPGARQARNTFFLKYGAESLHAYSGYAWNHSKSKMLHTGKIIETNESAVFRLLDLPAELRNLVYQDLLTLRPPRRGPAKPRENGRYCGPEVLATSRQINEDAERVLYWVNDFEVTITSTFGYTLMHSFLEEKTSV